MRLGGCAWGSLLKCRGLDGLEIWWLVGWLIGDDLVCGAGVSLRVLRGVRARGMGTYSYTDTQSLLHVTLKRTNNILTCEQESLELRIQKMYSR